MKYRILGGTSLKVSVICLGPMRAAAKAPGNDEKSAAGERALRMALDAGVNFIHSSYEYGTRWMIKRVLKDHPLRNELHHVIKLPVPDFRDNDRFDRATFRLRVEEALADLCTERISVLQYMWRSDPNTDDRRIPLLDRILDDVLEVFEKMRDEGKVGYLMTFPYTVACARAAMETGKFSGLIAYYNLIEMEMAELFDDLRQREMGFLAIRPLYQGILTDERVDLSSLGAEDRFKDDKYAQDFAKRSTIAGAMREEIQGSMTSFAIRCALADPIVAGVVVGLNTPHQVEGIVAAADGELPGEEVLEKALQTWREF